MTDNMWSPFDPEWYKNAFDKFESVADQLFNQDRIIEQGYVLPDADGSKSSVFRNDAVLNNSFSEKDLRDTLKDIYLNSSHKLIASNHDNVHFFQWNGYMSDMSIIKNSEYCEFKIPTETFLTPKEKELFKISQFSKKWIKVEDILNNWDVFKYHCMLFINQKIYSEYELRIDDIEVTIRFKYNEYWVRNNYPVYIYKFDTNSQCRILISRELCENQWDWFVPIYELDDQRILNSKNIIVTFNKISDQEIRADGNTNVEVLGDNIEFLKIEDGYIDLHSISRFNRIYIKSEPTEYLWMSIISPKFLHEYPILLPTDTIYRPYEANFQRVCTLENNVSSRVKTNNHEEETSQVYVDLNGKIKESYNGWKQMIRPIVLSDAFDNPGVEPYDSIIDDVKELRDSTVKIADIIEKFPDYKNLNHSDFCDYLDEITDSISRSRESMHKFFDKMYIEYIPEYEDQYSHYIDLIEGIKSEGIYSEWFNTNIGDSTKDFWLLTSPLINIPREIADMYYYIFIIHDMGSNKDLWDEKEEFLGQVRFQRPIDISDFWTFEYDEINRVWRPYPLNISRNFPDVYVIEDKRGINISKIYKAFFFYSDTMNVLNKSNDIIRSSESWDKDFQEYCVDQGAVYRDIFMEKFYWMGIKSIYKGMLSTTCRWEVIERIIDNDSYSRFNELFMKTMDPYFKLGLATYLRSSNLEFPFDDAISKLKESIDNKWLGYKKVTNFEIYLNKNWIPSYFDYITKIMDDCDFSKRLVRRPRKTFDIYRLIPIFIDIQSDVSREVYDVNTKVQLILDKIRNETYNLNIKNFEELVVLTQKMYDNMENIINTSNTLDLEIYSIDDINRIIKMIDAHNELLSGIQKMFNNIFEDYEKNNIHDKKRSILVDLGKCVDRLPKYVDSISVMINTFDIDGFMKAINDLRSYFTFDKRNPDDKSLIGHINKFDDPWSMSVKESRNKLFVSTSKLYGIYDPESPYEDDKLDEFISLITEVKNDIKDLNVVINKFWEVFKYDKDQNIIDKLDHVEYMINNFTSNVSSYMSEREDLIIERNNISNLVNEISGLFIGDTESKYKESILLSLSKLITSMSYIVGINVKSEGYKYISEIIELINTWNSFLDEERDIFNNIGELCIPPINFFDVLSTHQSIINNITKYMNTVNIEFIPDNSWPTYSDIYEIKSVDIITGGFNNSIGDKVYIPNIGSYMITEVDDSGSALKIEEINFRKTIFRDPLIQNNPYDSITDGVGMGIVVKPVTVKHSRIINDEIILNVIKKINSIITLINIHLTSINPFDNINMDVTINKIEDLKSSWEEILRVYSEYMSSEIKDYGNKMIDLMLSLIPECNKYMELRSNIKLDKLIDNLESFINSSYKYMEENNKLDQTYMYYDEMIREPYNSLCLFYDNGTTWSEKDKLRTILDDFSYTINTFYEKGIKNGNEELSNLYNEILTQINEIIYTINSIPNESIDINSILSSIDFNINNYNVKKDLWYKIKLIRIANQGSEYRVGDIVEINSDDPIYLQITEVDDGKVVKVQPMMDYAIPYLVWGVIDTITKTGAGSGLSVDVYSYEIKFSDSTIFMDNKSHISTLPQYDENDMFVFKFENIHDLDMNYEVFLGGKQINDFYKRRETVDDPLHPKNIDALYINANEVMGLKDSSIYMEAENYFVYKINNVIIKDPGAGYSVGQDVFVDIDQMMLRLKVAKLILGPLKGIGEVEVVDSLIFEGDDPASKNAKVVTDRFNNIDDEFNDQQRNSIYMYPDVGEEENSMMEINRPKVRSIWETDGEGYVEPERPMNKFGDPDYQWYQGSRIDNSCHPIEDLRRWNGIMNVVPPTDPFIPDRMRVPTNQPIKGEYLKIKDVKIHRLVYSGIEIYNEISRENVCKIWDSFGEGLRDPKNNPNYSMQEMANSVVYSVWSTGGEGYVEPEDWQINKTIVDRIWETNGDNYGTPKTITIDNSDNIPNIIKADFMVTDFAHLPKHTEDWPGGAINKTVLVRCDETHDGHRMLYRIRTFVAAGFFVYDIPEYADVEWDSFIVNWMDIDSYPDLPSEKAQYPDAPWNTARSYIDIQRGITDEKYPNKFSEAILNNTSYIYNVTLDDLSVFNWTTHEWEDLHDERRWKLDVYNEENNWGFKLTFLGDYLLEQCEDGFSFDMSLYLNKTVDTQSRNAELKKDAIIDINSVIISEVNKAALNASVYTGRHLRIRKLFPYEQKESFIIGIDNDGNPLGYEMNFRLNRYNYYRNEIHLEDVKIYNKTVGRFEDIFDRNMFEVRFKDPKAISRGFETQTTVVRSLINKAGEGFVDGEVWGWNAEHGTHIFGTVTADFNTDGHLLTFETIHFVNPPKEDINLEFSVFQHVTQSELQMAVIMVEFKTERVEVYGDGYIHNVRNRFAPIPNEFKVIAQYNLDGPYEYDIIISKTPRKWRFIGDKFMTSPTLHIDDYSIQQDRLYVLTDKGRFPLINPCTYKPFIHSLETENGTDVTFLNLYRRYETLELRSVPYPMRSVYVQRRIPSHGFIDLDGKLNKPINKKYFEFWVNGKLLFDEVTIISPTKIFLHGLKSLKNLEIIEINRDPNEYFSDIFLEVKDSKLGRPYSYYNYKTYLDSALEGTLDGDNYTTEEQEYLLSPVWKQVDIDHPEYKNYPPNVDIEDDILLRSYNKDLPIDALDNPIYQYLVVDPPTINGHPIIERESSFKHFGLIPISNSTIVDMLNEEWKEEIEKDPYLHEHVVMSDDEWYGTTARLYDEFGILVHTLNEAAYKVSDRNVLRINTSNKTSKIIKNVTQYDLD